MRAADLGKVAKPPVGTHRRARIGGRQKEAARPEFMKKYRFANRKLGNLRMKFRTRQKGGAV
jgi:hypothetical protein